MSKFDEYSCNQFLDRSFSDWICQLKQTMFGPEDTSGKSKQPFHCLLLEYSQTKLTIYNVQCMAKFERRITITIGVYRTCRGLGWSLKLLVVWTKKRCQTTEWELIGVFFSQVFRWVGCRLKIPDKEEMSHDWMKQLAPMTDETPPPHVLLCALCEILTVWIGIFLNSVNHCCLHPSYFHLRTCALCLVK